MLLQSLSELDSGGQVPKTQGNGGGKSRFPKGDRPLPFRLNVVQGDRTIRIPLFEGRLVVGSAADADVRLTHLSVSRRHGLLHVSSDGVEVEDLGSRNGTRLGDDRVRARVPVPPGVPLLFGSAVTTVESLEADDTEVGIALPPAPGLAKEGSPEVKIRATTIAPSVLESFTLALLPDLLARMVASEDPGELVQTVAEGLFRNLPCNSLELLHCSEDAEAVLFRARRDRQRSCTDQPAPVEVTCGDLTLRAIFPQSSMIEVFEPLLRAGANLVALCRRPVGAGRHNKPTAPDLDACPLPDPPTVSPQVRRIYADAARIATGMVSVLIQGESGTGKEVLARFVHEASPRSEGPLVTLNCAALPRDLLESELFGVEGGVATGVEARPGRFELAHGGTLFLDEIGDMALETQARILRVLQEKEVFRIGARKACPADVRIVSATNRDLESMLEDGTFRRDLFHRIADWVVNLPPLRDRQEDIPNLAVYFLGRACSERGVAAAGVSRAALAALTAHFWPGNIRQLQKEMARAALFLEDGDLLDTRLLQPAILEIQGQTPPSALKEILEVTERKAIEAVLVACDGDIPEAARRLHVSRSTFYRRLAALGIEG